jgi:alanine racemase
MNPTSRIEIDLSAIDHNLTEWRRVVGPGCEICAVLKADAYGLGALHLSRRLGGKGIKLIAVYSMAQANELAVAGVPVALLVLMPIENLERTDPLYRPLVAGRLHMTVHSLRQLDKIEAIGLKFGTAIPVHVEVDTGLTRLGMGPGEVAAVLEAINKRRYVKLAGLFTHTASAGHDVAFTEQQLGCFDALVKSHAALIPADAALHFAGTLAALRDKQYHKTMVRLGLGLFGYGEADLVGKAALPAGPRLLPAVRWVSQIVHIRSVPAGTSVGYNRIFTTDRESRLGIVPAGYADGYPLALSNKGVVRVGVNLLPAPVRGQVNMDQVAIDLTDLPHADIGTDVELIASDPAAPNAMPALAKLAETSVYEVLCRLSPRTSRRYVTLDRATGQYGHVATL